MQQRPVKPAVVHDPATDYWRPLRSGIREAFEAGWQGDESIDQLKLASPDPKKQQRYAECVAGLRSWTGRKQFGSSTRKDGVWESDGLSVSVNPELLLDIDGIATAVKLYFKADKLAKPRVNTLLHLMGQAVPGRPRPAILDVPRGKLIIKTVSVPDLDIVLGGDAAQFMTMWRRLNEIRDA